MPLPIDLSKQRIGRLVVQCIDPELRGRRHWVCVCDCGKTKSVSSNKLLSKTRPTKSCGCISTERIRALRRTHGLGGTKIYRCWKNLQQRCKDPKNIGFGSYGDRGISVCQRWADSFEDFVKDMGDYPSQKHSLDRKNNNLGYWCGKPECPECGPLGREPNCQWATKKEQMRNRQRNRWIICHGYKITAADWFVITGIPDPTIHHRLNRGWTPDRILHDPRYPDWQSRLSAFVAENPTVCVTVGESQSS